MPSRLHAVAWFAVFGSAILAAQEPAAEARPRAGVDEHRIVAWVGRQVITSRAVAEKAGAAVMAAEPRERERILVSTTLDLIEDAAVLQEADRIGLAITDRIVKDAINRQFESDREYEEVLLQRGISGERYEQETGQQIVRNSYLGARASISDLGPGLRSQHFLTPRIGILRDEYQRRIKDFTVEARTKVRLLAISRSTITRSENLTEPGAFEAWLKGLENDLKTGADFLLLTERYDATPKEESGREEWIDAKTQLSPAIVEAAKAAEVGTVVGPIGPPNGGTFFFAQVLEREAARVIPFAEAQKKLREDAIRFARNRAVLSETLAVLEQAYIRPAELRALVLERKRRQLNELQR